MSSKQKLTDGTYVRHLLSGKEGRINGTTRKLWAKFESKADKFEYRVQTNSDDIQIWSPSNLEPINFEDELSQLIRDVSKAGAGRLGEYLTCKELRWRAYEAEIMPALNEGYDLRCNSPGKIHFVVEAKCSTSKGTQAPVQLSHLQGAPRADRFYVFVKYIDGILEEFVVMTNEEVHAAWALMRKVKATGERNKINGGYLDWMYLTPHRERWDKLPK